MIRCIHCKKSKQTKNIPQLYDYLCVYKKGLRPVVAIQFLMRLQKKRSYESHYLQN